MPKVMKQCSITIGRPVHPDRYAREGEPQRGWRSMIDEVLFEIREMTGQVYKNIYAGKTSTSENVVFSRVAHTNDVLPDEGLLESDGDQDQSDRDGVHSGRDDRNHGRSSSPTAQNNRTEVDA
jgi:hypothetical protein